MRNERCRRGPASALPRAGARSGGFSLAITGLGGLIIGGIQEALDRPGRRGRYASNLVVVPAAAAVAMGGELWRRRRERSDDAPADENEISVVKSLAMSLAVAGVTATISAGERKLADRIARAAARVLPGNESLWRPLGHVASLAAIGAGTRFAMQRGFGMIESREEAVEPSFDLPPPHPYLSGSLESDVPYATLSKQGRRFVWNAQAPEVISEIMDEDAVDVIRVYVGLESADDEAQRVALAMRELERTSAFDREWLLIDMPTGTGYVNYAAVSVLEMLSRGNCATVAMQYAARPSPLSLDRVDEGRKQARLLIDAISERIRGMPVEGRPKVVLFGESLGAWTSQDAFLNQGTQGLVDAGVDYAIWIGTPHFSRWKEQVLRDQRDDVEPELIGVFNDIDEWEATPAEQRDRMRYVMITHHNDGVARFGPGLVVQAPEWLGDSESRWREIPRGMRWTPNTTFFQTLVDMKNSANVVAGVFAATGHDYRGDLLPFFRAVLDITVTDEQMQRLTKWLQDRELMRSEWVKRHGTADTSLAASLVNTWMRENPTRANELILERVRALAIEDFVAAGGAANEAPVLRPKSRE